MKTTRDYQDFSNLPSWLPKKLGAVSLTPEQLSNRINVSRTMVYAYLSDQSRPSEQTALRMSRVLGVKFEELLAQYTPKRTGRPVGSNGTAELKVRNK